MSGGVPAGAKNACHESTTTDGNSSDIDATSGAKRDRFDDVTASARSWFWRIMAMVAGKVTMVASIWPPTASMTAGPAPRYGTWTTGTPAWTSSAIARWPGDPTPEVP